MEQYDLVAENKNSTVVAEYKSKYKRGLHYFIPIARGRMAFSTRLLSILYLPSR